MRFFTIGCLLLLVCSCGPKEWYSHEVHIPDNGWHKDSVAVFKSDIEDLNKSCHLLLEVKNKENYAYNNIWFFIDAVSPSGNVERDTLECYLSNEKGEWIGKPSGVDTYKSIQPYKLNIRFPEKGLYTYCVIQGMRDTVLLGIESVGLKIIEVK